jgi:hypothetical protein
MTITETMKKLLGEAKAGPNEIWMDLPLFIRLLEFAREDAHDDIDLHDIAELAAKHTQQSESPLSMDAYEKLMPKGHAKNSGGQGKPKSEQPKD